MIGDDESKVEYQNRCARHAEFYEGCGPCTGNATEEFLLERNYQQHLKQNIVKPPEAVRRIYGGNLHENAPQELRLSKCDDPPFTHEFKEGDKLTESIEQLGGFVVGPPMSIQEFADVVKQGIEHSKKLDEAVKDDDDKPRYDLLPPNALSELVAVYTMGAKKYAPRNWEKGLRWGRVFAALMRHAWAWWSGESRDHESGLNHMAHVAWCALALAEYNMSPKNVGEDDRPVERVESPEYFQTSPYSVSIFDSIGVMVAHTTFVDYEEARDFVTREIISYHGGHAHIKNRQGTVMWEGVHD